MQEEEKKNGKEERGRGGTARKEFIREEQKWRKSVNRILKKNLNKII